MRTVAASITCRRPILWLQRHGHRVRLASCFLSLALATEIIRTTSENNLIWVANGVLLSYVLLAARRRWPAYFAAGFMSLFAGSLLSGLTVRMSLLLSALNLLEVLVAALLLRKRSTAPPQFISRDYLVRFVCFGMLAAPLISGLIVALLSFFWPRIHLGATPLQWIAADSLGIGIVTPICVAILRWHFGAAHIGKRHLIYLFLLAAATPYAFSHPGGPLLFAIYPLLALILIRTGMRWAAISTLLVAVAGCWFTLHGQGPFTQTPSLTPLDPILLLQVFIGSAVLLLYSISLVLEREWKVVQQLEKIAALHALVSENSRDAIILADLSGHRSYGSSAAQSIDGWRPEELMTSEGLEMVHPDDRARAQFIIGEFNSGSVGAMIECRIRNRNGEYIWVEASLRLVRDPETGQPTGILNVVRDVSERKQAEKKLQEAYNAVEALAVTDALTGLANRRRFDQYLASEWRRSMREREPLSLLMLDVDNFKIYNDTYGHPRGDNCLKQIAEACMDVVSRPADLVARFGGEEFVVVLPNTESEGAMCVGNEICEALRRRKLPHSGNAAGIATISIGCATLVPKIGKHAPDLTALADSALYAAKQKGRNQVCLSNIPEKQEEATADSANPESATCVTA